MKLSIALAIVFTLVASCSTFHPPKDKIVAIQPLGDIRSVSIADISKTIADFYHFKVVVLPSIPLPHTFVNYEKGERYSSDSLIQFLSKRNSDSVLITIGITEKDIFCTKYETDGSIKKPEYKYRVFGIFGLAKVLGSSCIVSSHRLKTPNRDLFTDRVNKIVLHEVGHNLGLQHCPNKGCLMESANESIATVDAEELNMCKDCRKSIKL